MKKPDTLSDCCGAVVWLKSLGSRKIICSSCLGYCTPIAQRDFKEGETIGFLLMPQK